MAITKPTVLPVWAESGDKVQPSNTEIQTGWPLSNVPPARQRFNWFFNYVMNAVRYFSRRGLPDWDAAETYATGDIGIGDDGKIYRSKINSNLNNVPSSSPSAWELSVSSLADMAADLQKQTYTAFTTGGTAPNYTLTPSPAITSYTAGQRFRIKMHAGNGSAPSTLNVSGLGAKALQLRLLDGPGTASLVQPNIAAGHLLDVEYNGTGFEMVSERGTPVATETATGVTQLATATQILTGASGGFVMNPQNFAANSNTTGGGPWHFQLPGGLTINWGWLNVSDDGYIAVSFDKPFTSVFMGGWATPVKNSAVGSGTGLGAHVGSVGLSGMSVGVSMPTGEATAGAYWFAIGI